MFGETPDPAHGEDFDNLFVAGRGRYIYNHRSCGRCGSPIRTWVMAARTCYACETCQPLQQGTVLAAARTKALAKATVTKVTC
jgi:hypothetical protein